MRQSAPARALSNLRIRQQTIGSRLRTKGCLSPSSILFRSVEQEHDYHEKLHDFIEQLERLLMMSLLVLLGGAVTAGVPAAAQASAAFATAAAPSSCARICASSSEIASSAMSAFIEVGSV